ncbi:protein HflC [Algimonas ampicilliniresistens]|uniref:Protein HflC n=1 Tax=Algimonas ampicilliniresistens TaxID=1298735 RepID=A0ABQ5V7R7_9PROT|nr:protease modulator HflC [Algimonas ampicilliniresistens]GLQ23583.1 protein HflC [Algimonas ampicilliniresistens]
MKNPRLVMLAVLGGLAILAIFASLFTVEEHEQAIVFQFGEAKRVENPWGSEPNAGLKMKTPFIENVVYLSRRNLEVDLRPVELLAADQERLIVDAFVRYRITNAIRFYEKLRNERGAQDQLQAIFDSTLRDVLGRVDTPEIISGRRSELMAEIQSVADGVAEAEDLGIDIIDVRIKRADLPRENYDRVFKRMVSQRNLEASLLRAEGEERAQEIRATAQKEARVIRAEAQRQAEIIRGEGDKERNAIYAAAYTKDPEFFAFYRSMDAYKKGLGNNTTYVLSPDSDFLGYLDDQQGGRR